MKRSLPYRRSHVHTPVGGVRNCLMLKPRVKLGANKAIALLVHCTEDWGSERRDESDRSKEEHDKSG